MSGLRNRMNRLRGASADNATEREALKQEETAEYDQAVEEAESLHSAWGQMGVTLANTPHGSYLVRKQSFSPTHRHGTHQIGELSEAAGGLQAFHPEAKSVDADRIFYLDLETTGLGVGAGNVPFMVGTAYREGDSFIVEQSFIRHPAEEYAMLRALCDRLQSFDYLATYNGKTFDWPLVQSRMIMNGINPRRWEPLHLDFLHPSRALWRNTLASCKLSYIEEERLGIIREDDVPGSLAPQLYFQFLSDGEPAPLRGVFEHNASDLLSLVCLSIRFGSLLRGDLFRRLPYPSEGEELIRTGLWLEKMHMTDLPQELFGLALNQPSAYPSALVMLAARDKKAGNWERAVLLWQKAITQSGPSFGAVLYESYTELAMYYEHKLRDLHNAQVLACEALQRAEVRFSYERHDKKRREMVQQLRKRLDRLERKLERKS
ncbi:ribonuclease H-like domain-containing protein [Paenibacillus sp. HB172176]|uniref:ribonuclease H-like domain-containing protein n=1 Tax=Paenibacillus sp. HB172176 TaxID=2493690 RepID=UPI00143AA482|nr:ribonuclease H-like domain-containing protein [Paenibacillus sp. HB172176]